MSDSAASVLSLPNLVSSSRFVLAAGFMLVEETGLRIGLLGLASLTDFLDGWLARRARLTSRLGALLDPVADRVFVLAVVLSYLATGELQLWQAVALLFRDVMSLIGWFVAQRSPSLRAIPFRARWPGKVLTALQLFVFLAALLWPSAVTPLVIVAAVLGVGATIDYTLMLWRERRVEAEGA
jgi:CDP-diacylglycerol--glycerol-3-phosphate 3-phosphatidyltransferase